MRYLSSIPASALAFLLCTNIVSAQTFSDYLKHPDISFGMSMIKFDEGVIFNGVQVPGRLNRSTARTFGAGINWNFPVLSISKDLALGVTPGFYGIMGPMVDDPSDNYTTSDDGQMKMALTALNIPLMAMVRYGVDATPKSDMKVGINAGIGYMPTWLVGTSSFFRMPGFMGEIGFRAGEKIIKMRYTGYIGWYDFGPAMTATQSSVDLVVAFR
jgi:hypothetical protein